MLNAVKSLIIGIIAIAILSSCDSSDNERNNSDAQALLAEIQSAVESRNFDRAILLLDSLDKAFPKAIEQRKIATSIRPKAIEGQTIRQIEINDSTTAAFQCERDSLMRAFVKIEKAVLLAPYFVHKSLAGKSIFERTGVEPRISDEGELSLTTSVVGRNCLHTSITLSAPDGTSVSTPVANYDGERNVRENGTEMIVFSASEAMPLVEFAKRHNGERLTLRFNGKTSFSQPLTDVEHKSLAASASLAEIQSQIKTLELGHTRLEHQLQIARDQSARTNPN